MTVLKLVGHREEGVAEAEHDQGPGREPLQRYPVQECRQEDEDQPAHFPDGCDVPELRPREVQDVLEVVGDDAALRVRWRTRRHADIAASMMKPRPTGVRHIARKNASNTRIDKGKWPPFYSFAPLGLARRVLGIPAL